MKSMVNRLKKMAADQEKFAKKLRVVEQQSTRAMRIKQEKIEV
ncbi:MAG: hypothetical protein P4M11_10205 [Candidatus Pacebacteria bacterium]|nr:hypothetical protein [Candidatus Paceibacterota bacterium]